MKDVSTFAAACKFALSADLPEPNPVMLVVETWMFDLSAEELEVVVELARQRLLAEAFEPAGEP